ncbi:MAG: DUF1559 domain-containing protein [Planctomycetaceae bacterium]|nr:DUF1559 domain-containing protein [Planctomycetaceae bacterium]
MRVHTTSTLQSLIHRRGEMSPVAIVFIILGVLFVVGTLLIGILLVLLLPAAQGARTAARRTQSKNNLRIVGLAAHNFHSVNGNFPPGDENPPESIMPRHSWTTRLLPYMEQNSLYQQIDFSQSWNAPANKSVFTTSLPSMLNPNLTKTTTDDGYAAGHYAGNIHLFPIGSAVEIREITDGTSNTLMIGEVGMGLAAWGDYLNIRDPMQGIGSGGSQFGGIPGQQGCQFVLADGSVRLISEDIDRSVLEALATPAGGEAIQPGGF